MQLQYRIHLPAGDKVSPVFKDGPPARTITFFGAVGDYEADGWRRQPLDQLLCGEHCGRQSEGE